MQLWCGTALATEWWCYDTSECQGNGRKYLLKLVRGSVVRDCVVSRLVELGLVYVSRSMVVSTY